MCIRDRLVIFVLYSAWQCGHCSLTFTSASVLNLHTLTHAADNLEGSGDSLVGISDELADACFKKQNGMIGCPQCTEVILQFIMGAVYTSIYY